MTQPRGGARRARYQPLDWMVVRAPLRPVRDYLALGASPEHVDSLAAAPDIRTALAVGGGDLAAALDRAGGSSRRRARRDATLLRYLIRLSTRPTPYGLFAGVGLTAPGPATTLAIEPGARPTRTRPDMGWLLGLVAELEGRAEVRRQARLVVNPTAYESAGRVAAADPARLGPGGEGAPAIGDVSVRATGAVRQVLAAARRPRPHAELVDVLRGLPGGGTAAAERCLDQLCDAGLLLTDLRPPLTVPGPARWLLDRLANVPSATEARDALAAVLAATAGWDAAPERDAAGFAALATACAAVPGAPQVATALQCDSGLALRGTVNTTVAADAAAAADLLLRLTPLPGGGPLAGYRHRFESRYGVDREVGLLDVLDPLRGLGPLDRDHGGEQPDPARLARRHRTLRRLATDALRDRRRSVELDRATIDALALWTPDAAALPPSLDVQLLLAARSAAAIDAGDYRLVLSPNLGAVSAGRVLGRFADQVPGGMRALRSAAAAEQAHGPDRVWAEVVYLPARARSANVAVRPAVRLHRIVLGGLPTGSDDIPVDELVVVLRDGRLQVRWPARDTEVVACAGHMLNNHAAPALVRFLEAVGRAGQAGYAGFDWGAQADLPALPRVTAGRLVLAPARWRLDPDDDDGAGAGAGGRGGAEAGDDARFAARLAAWRSRWDVPRYVHLSAGDNWLQLDLDDPAQRGLLAEELRRLPPGGALLLHEALPAPDDAWLPGPGGRHVAELGVPVALPAPAARAARRPQPLRLVTRLPAPAPVPDAIRLRPPGSEWTFLTLYAPPADHDGLLTGPVREFADYAVGAGLAQDWFFLRYRDTGDHLRVRFRGEPGGAARRLLGEVASFAAEVQTAGLADRVVLDTYDREVDRYGGDAGCRAAEELSGVDSRAVVELLAECPSADRALLAVLTVDDLLAGLGLTEADRLAWCRSRVGRSKSVGDTFRGNRDTLRAMLADRILPLPPAAAGTVSAVLAARVYGVTEVARTLTALQTRGELHHPLDELAGSYVHMHLNRLLGMDRAAEERTLGWLLRARESLANAPLQASAARTG